MIKCEFLKKTIEGLILCRTYSTEDKYIKQVETDIEYEEAVDVGIEENGQYKPKFYTYEETNKPIKIEE